MFSRYEVNGEALGDTRVKHRRVPGLVTRNLLKPRRMQVRLYRIAGVTSDGGRGVGDDPPKDDTEVELMHQDAHCRTQRIADSLDVRHAGVVREEYWVDCMVVAIEKHTGMFEVEVDSHLELGVAKYNRKVGRATVDPWTAGMTRQDGVGHSLVGVLHALRSDLRQGQPRYQHLLGKPWGVAVFAPGEVGRVMDGSSVVVADQEKVRRGGRGGREERERREGRMCVCVVCCSCTQTPTYPVSHAIYSLISLQNCLHIFHNILDGKNNPERPYKVKSGYDHTIGTFGSRRGELHGPRGICIDSDGRIIVADTCNNRVQAFRFVPRGQAGIVFHREAFSAPWQKKYHGYVCGETPGRYLNLKVISSSHMSPLLRTLIPLHPTPRPYHQVRASEKLRGGCQNSPRICIARRPVGSRLDLPGQH